jgi:hypothetical protein
MSDYPQNFTSWSQDARNDWFAKGLTGRDSEQRLPIPGSHGFAPVHAG